MKRNGNRINDDSIDTQFNVQLNRDSTAFLLVASVVCWKASDESKRNKAKDQRIRSSQAVDGNKRKAKDGRQAEERLSGLRKKRGEPPDLFKSNTKGKQREREEENTEGKQREREEPCKTRTVT